MKDFRKQFREMNKKFMEEVLTEIRNILFDKEWEIDEIVEKLGITTRCAKYLFTFDESMRYYDIRQILDIYDRLKEIK